MTSLGASCAVCALAVAYGDRRFQAGACAPRLASPLLACTQLTNPHTQTSHLFSPFFPTSNHIISGAATWVSSLAGFSSSSSVAEGIRMAQDLALSMSWETPSGSSPWMGRDRQIPDGHLSFAAPPPFQDPSRHWLLEVLHI